MHLAMFGWQRDVHRRCPVRVNIKLSGVHAVVMVGYHAKRPGTALVLHNLRHKHITLYQISYRSCSIANYQFVNNLRLQL